MDKDLSDKLDGISDMVNRIHECLYGNGNPGYGLTDRVTSIEIKLKWLIRVGGILILLMGSLLGIDKAFKLDIFP